MKTAVVTVIGLMLLVAVWSVGSEQYKKHEAAERGRRNTAKYFTLVFTPCAGTCTVQSFLRGEENHLDPAHRECVTNVQFQPAGADIVFVTYTNSLGVREIEKAAVVPSPMAVHGGTYTTNGKTEWCEL